MREYTYRVTQMAVRQGKAYRRATLILEPRGEQPHREYDLFLETTVVGSGRWANIPLRDESVSAVHAKIKKVDQRFIVYDLLSAGGVYLNGRKLLRPRALRDGDELRIGRTRFRFRGRS
jgi:pSer/pThr/pTyr-binding forkhead associated (FHA) protein